MADSSPPAFHPQPQLSRQLGIIVIMVIGLLVANVPIFNVWIIKGCYG